MLGWRVARKRPPDVMRASEGAGRSAKWWLAAGVKEGVRGGEAEGMSPRRKHRSREKGMPVGWRACGWNED